MAVEMFRRTVRGDELTDFFVGIRSNGWNTDDLMFLCIGTDRSTGDALGPLVGTGLLEAGYRHVIGTLEHPCDANNLLAVIEAIDPIKKVVAIDACLGQPVSVGMFQVSNQPLLPGKSVGKALPAVGDYSIAAIVNADGAKKYSILQSTSLYRVMGMARDIVLAVRGVFPPGRTR